MEQQGRRNYWILKRRSSRQESYSGPTYVPPKAVQDAAQLGARHGVSQTKAHGLISAEAQNAGISHEEAAKRFANVWGASSGLRLPVRAATEAPTRAVGAPAGSSNIVTAVAAKKPPPVKGGTVYDAANAAPSKGAPSTSPFPTSPFPSVSPTQNAPTGTTGLTAQVASHPAGQAALPFAKPTPPVISPPAAVAAPTGSTLYGPKLPNPISDLGLAAPGEGDYHKFLAAKPGSRERAAPAAQHTALGSAPPAAVDPAHAAAVNAAWKEHGATTTQLGEHLPPGVKAENATNPSGPHGGGGPPSAGSEPGKNTGGSSGSGGFKLPWGKILKWGIPLGLLYGGGKLLGGATRFATNYMAQPQSPYQSWGQLAPAAAHGIGDYGYADTTH